MLVVVDTNFVGKDYFLVSPRIDTFLAILESKGAELVLTTLVRDEMVGNYLRDLRDCIGALKGTCGELRRRLHIDDGPKIEIDVEKAVQMYTDHIHARLAVKKDAVRDFKDEYLHNVVARAIDRMPPCSSDGEEIRDAVLWCLVKDLLRESTGVTVAFISGDKGQFGDPKAKGKLHPRLQAELDDEKLSLEFHHSIDDFAQHYAAPKPLVNEAVLAASIQPQAVLERCRPILSNMLRKKLSIYGRVLESINHIAGALEPTEQFDHKAPDGVVRTELIYTGNVSISYSLSTAAAQLGVWPDLGSIGTSAYTWTASGEGPPEDEQTTAFPTVLPYAAPERYQGYIPQNQIGLTTANMKVSLDVLVKDGKVIDWTIGYCTAGPFIGL